MGDARPSILAPNRSYPLPPLFPLFPIMILTKTRISLGLPPPNPAYHLAWVHRAVYPLAWDPQTPHIPWLGIPKPRISLGLGFPKPEYPLAWDSQNPHIPWLRFSLFSRFSFFAQIGIAAPLVEPAPQRRLPHTQLRSHFKSDYYDGGMHRYDENQLFRKGPSGPCWWNGHHLNASTVAY